MAPRNLYSLKASKPFRKPLEPNMCYQYWRKSTPHILLARKRVKVLTALTQKKVLGAPLGLPNRGGLLFRIRSRVFFARHDYQLSNYWTPVHLWQDTYINFLAKMIGREKTMAIMQRMWKLFCHQRKSEKTFPLFRIFHLLVFWKLSRYLPR